MNIQYADGSHENGDIVLGLALNQLIFKGGVTGDHYLSIDFPYNLSKIPPKYQNVGISTENVLVFRNDNFSEYDICEIRIPGQNERHRIGFLFKPAIIFEPDSDFIFKDDRILQVAIFRGIIALLSDNASLKSKRLIASRENDFRFSDFFDEDIIIGVFPHDWNENFDSPVVTGILYNLYRYGFYILKSEDDLNFQPPVNTYQQSNFDNLPLQKSSFRRYLDINILCDKLIKTNYCQYFIHDLVKHSGNDIARFHQIYGLIEIFKDEVLRHEINEKVRKKDIFSPDLTGHKLHKKILDISNDAYCVDKLFSKYRHGSKDLIDHSFLEIFYFIEKYRDKTELESLREFPQLFYYLRNIIVHDIQFLFPIDEVVSSQIRLGLSDIVNQIEFTVLETLIGVKFPINAEEVI